ncbi:hypothetical protein D3C71_1854740 [compost metagenome]
MWGRDCRRNLVGDRTVASFGQVDVRAKKIAGEVDRVFAAAIPEGGIEADAGVVLVDGIARVVPHVRAI